MSNYSYNIVYDDGQPSSITVVFRGAEPHMASAQNPRFQQIVDACQTGKPDRVVRDLLSPQIAVQTRFSRLSERVTVTAGRIFFDGDQVHDSLAQAIVAFYDAGEEDFKPLLAFMEKIEQNPNPHSREHLFRWLEKRNFALMPDGDFVAYKGLDNSSKSIHTGPAIVNGEWVHGKVLNAPETIVEIPRSQVEFDPGVACSTGLHAGTYNYARGFAQGRVVAVKINPRDVVSVPSDSYDEKLRVCRYRVMGPVSAEETTHLFLRKIAERTQRVAPKEATVRPGAKAASPKGPGRGRKGVATKADRAGEGAGAGVKFPRYYEQFEAVHFEAESWSKLRWLAKEWGVSLPRGSKRPDFVAALVIKAAERLAAW